jgi:acetolactate synthase regulatory subunit
MKQEIRLLVQDQPGVLMRVAGVITSKGANISHLAATADDQREGLAHIYVVADIEPRLRQRVLNEMNRLLEVFEADDVTPGAPLVQTLPIGEADSDYWTSNVRVCDCPVNTSLTCRVHLPDCAFSAILKTLSAAPPGANRLPE